MNVDSLVKQMQLYMILDAVIVVLLLTFIELFVWTYMAVNYGTCVVNIPKNTYAKDLEITSTCS